MPRWIELCADIRDATGIWESDMFALVAAVAETRTTVLLTGESGTGKTILARSLHAASDRAAGPFVEVNCGALPDELLESELFGHMKGSFTGATNNKKGLFEVADGGSLFFDGSFLRGRFLRGRFLPRSGRRVNPGRVLRARFLRGAAARPVRRVLRRAGGAPPPPARRRRSAVSRPARPHPRVRARGS